MILQDSKCQAVSLIWLWKLNLWETNSGHAGHFCCPNFCFLKFKVEGSWCLFYVLFSKQQHVSMPGHAGVLCVATSIISIVIFCTSHTLHSPSSMPLPATWSLTTLLDSTQAISSPSHAPVKLSEWMPWSVVCTLERSEGHLLSFWQMKIWNLETQTSTGLQFTCGRCMKRRSNVRDSLSYGLPPPPCAQITACVCLRWFDLHIYRTNETWGSEIGHGRVKIPHCLLLKEA